MKKLVLLISFLIILSPFILGQGAGKIGGAERDAVGKIDKIPIESVGKVGNVSAQYCKSCKEILEKYPASPDGVYTIDTDSSGDLEPFECYCNMTTRAGPWCSLTFPMYFSFMLHRVYGLHTTMPAMAPVPLANLIPYMAIWMYAEPKP